MFVLSPPFVVSLFLLFLFFSCFSFFLFPPFLFLFFVSHFVFCFCPIWQVVFDAAMAYNSGSNGVVEKEKKGSSGASGGAAVPRKPGGRQQNKVGRTNAVRSLSLHTLLAPPCIGMPLSYL